MTETKWLSSTPRTHKQNASFVGRSLIAQDNPECEGYAILSMAMTDERGEKPNQKGSQEMKCLPALSLEEWCDGT